MIGKNLLIAVCVLVSTRVQIVLVLSAKECDLSSKKVNKMQSIITALFLGLKYKRGTVWEGQTPLVTVVYSLGSC